MHLLGRFGGERAPVPVARRSAVDRLEELVNHLADGGLSRDAVTPLVLTAPGAGLPAGGAAEENGGPCWL
jgi:hypothetical protein